MNDLELSSDYNLTLMCVYYNIYINPKIIEASPLQIGKSHLARFAMVARAGLVNEEYAKSHTNNQDLVHDLVRLDRLVKAHSKKDILTEIDLRKIGLI